MSVIENKPNKRNRGIDTLRGIAIAIMIFANSIGYIAPGYDPFFSRFFGSLAAPLFIFLSGCMIGFGKRKEELITENYSFKLIYKGLIIIITGILIDSLIWKIYPFTSFDVLYLIGIGLIIFPIFLKISRNTLFICFILILLIAFGLQFRGYYRNEINEIDLGNKVFKTSDIEWKAFLLDGWFPIFPWLSYMIGGYWVSQLENFKIKFYKILIAILIFGGALTTTYYFQIKIIRHEYSELFYAPDFLYVSWSFAFLYLTWSFKSIFSSSYWFPFQQLGKCSLFIYVLHSLVISICFNDKEVNKEKYSNNIFLTYFVFLFTMIVIAWILNQLKKNKSWPKLPYTLRFFLGS